MNKAKRNRIKNKEKIKQLKQQLKNVSTKEPTIVYVTDTDTEKECKLLRAEVDGLHRFISRVNIDFAPLIQTFNIGYPELVLRLSDGSLTPRKLDAIRMRKYSVGRYTHEHSEPLYMIGLVPEGESFKEIQASFYLSPDLIRDVPIDYLLEKQLKQILKTRKNDLLMKE